ncbi:MAG TPA: glycosyltransferase, partial [Acidimicrobiales bacterium]|nr:glycosyltransferase [Acidimicrobiales bacterium]
ADAQPLALAERGAAVIWTCHVGADQPNACTRAAWDFLRPYLERARAYVFSSAEYAWEGLRPDRVVVIPPCLDAFSPKNQTLSDGEVAAILNRCGLIPDGGRTAPTFVRQNGSTGVVSERARVFQESELAPDSTMVTQVSRWDPLKDHVGVMRAFTDHVPADLMGHLVLAGPSPESVADDPEGWTTFEELVARWEDLAPPARSRVHIACLPMEDGEENAAVVNALQRRSDVIVQKSLAEGFGLTVAEAMWKARPTIGSRVGGIQDQIEHGRSGLLVDDSEDLAAAVG